jgi:hypothetical protein
MLYNVYINASGFAYLRCARMKGPWRREKALTSNGGMTVEDVVPIALSQTDLYGPRRLIVRMCHTMLTTPQVHVASAVASIASMELSLYHPLPDAFRYGTTNSKLPTSR